MDREDKIIREKIKSLDKVSPPVSWSEDQLWDNISQNNNEKSLLLRWSVAASITGLLALAIYLLVPQQQESVMLSYSTETSESSDNQLAFLDELDSEAMQFIKTECLHFTEVCKSPEFQSLSDELASLSTEMLEIDNMIEKYGEDPTFIASKAQVEGMMSEITNQLIQMVLS